MDNDELQKAIDEIAKGDLGGQITITDDNAENDILANEIANGNKVVDVPPMMMPGMASDDNVSSAVFNVPDMSNPAVNAAPAVASPAMGDAVASAPVMPAMEVPATSSEAAPASELNAQMADAPAFDLQNPVMTDINMPISEMQHEETPEIPINMEVAADVNIPTVPEIAEVPVEPAFTMPTEPAITAEREMSVPVGVKDLKEEKVINDETLAKIKDEALKELVPVLEKVELSPVQKFKIYRNMVKKGGDEGKEWADEALAAAKAIVEDEVRGEALVELISLIDEM